MPCAVAHIELRAAFGIVEKLVCFVMKAPHAHPAILAFNIFRFAIVAYIDLHDCWPK